MNKVKSSRILLVLGILVLALSSCSEESQIAKNVEGIWDIAVYQKTVYQDNNIELNLSGTFEFKGKIEFNSSGKGYYNILEDLGTGTYYGSANFTWTNTSDQLTIMEGTSSKIFNIINHSKTSFELERVVDDFYFPGSEPGLRYSMIERLILEK